MTVTIKTPPVYDLSKWEIVTDWAGLNPKPTLVILRATYGANYVDPLYLQYYRDAKVAGYPVWSYHFFLYEDSWSTQANAFINTVKLGGIGADLKPIIDIEGYLPTSVSQATANGMIENWLKTVEQALGRYCYIYSSKNYLSTLYSSTPPAWLSNANRLKWIAGYPTDPNGYSTMPTSYLPVGIPASQVALWQYSDKGVVGGITGGVDLNNMTDWFKAQWTTISPTVELTDKEKLDRLWNAHPELH